MVLWKELKISGSTSITSGPSPAISSVFIRMLNSAGSMMTVSSMTIGYIALKSFTAPCIASSEYSRYIFKTSVVFILSTIEEEAFSVSLQEVHTCTMKAVNKIHTHFSKHFLFKSIILLYKIVHS